MERWTYAPGFPVLNATLGADGRSVMVTQARRWRVALPRPQAAALHTWRRMPGAAAHARCCCAASSVCPCDPRPVRVVRMARRARCQMSCFACIQQQGAAHARRRQAARRGRPPRAGAVHGRGRAALRRRRGRAAALVGAACRRAGRWRGGGARLARRGRVPAGVQRRRARGAPARLGQLPAPAPGGCRRARHAERSARGRRTLSARRGAA